MHDDKIWQVSGFTQVVKKNLETNWGYLWIEGELSGFKRYPSGHAYFTIKDQQAQISCVMFASYYRQLCLAPSDGLSVRLFAKASLYPERGQFQLLVEKIIISGDGYLKKAFEALKKKLLAAGLFDEKNKKPIPRFAQCLGLITSSEGAALHDILVTAKRRFAGLPIIVYPALVQGEQAVPSVVGALALANKHKRCDVLILARGGGSLQDLQAFNEEAVARAIFESQIPIISAIGHEVDITIADLTADLRAPTPTAAAELITPLDSALLAQLTLYQKRLSTLLFNLLSQQKQTLSHLEQRLKSPESFINHLEQTLQQYQSRLHTAIKHHCHMTQVKHENLAAQLQRYHPLQILARNFTLLKDLLKRLNHAILSDLQNKSQYLERYLNTLHHLSPLQVLDRGYALAMTKHNELLRSTKGLKKGDVIKIQLAEGQIIAHIEKTL